MNDKKLNHQDAYEQFARTQKAQARGSRNTRRELSNKKKAKKQHQ